MPKIDITNSTVKKAKADAKPGVKRHEITDARQRGLEIRVGARAAVWSYRWEKAGRSNRLELGGIDEWDITKAREIAAEAATAVRSGITPDDEWMRQQRIKRGRLTEILVPEPVAVLTWDWDEAITAYLAEVERTKKPRTLVDYRNMLKTPELGKFTGRAVSTITLKEMLSAVADVHSRGVERHAEHLASVIRPMWKFLSHLTRQDKSGVIDRRLMEYLEAPPRSRSVTRRKKAKYAPPIHEVGRMLVIARSGVFEPTIAASMELLLFSVQRVNAVATAYAEDFKSIGDNRIDGLWSMPPTHRKTAESRGDEADHIVPLPRQAWAAVQRMLDINDDQDPNPFLFRGLRPKRKGDVVGSMAASNIQHGMLYSPGITMTPHDMRRAFTTIGADQWRWTLKQCKTILDHLEGNESGDVTVINYLWNGQHEKWDMMRLWCDLLEEAAVEALAFDQRLGDLDWLKAHIVAQRDLHKHKIRPGISLAKPPQIAGTSPLTSP